MAATKMFCSPIALDCYIFSIILCNLVGDIMYTALYISSQIDRALKLLKSIQNTFLQGNHLKTVTQIDP